MTSLAVGYSEIVRLVGGYLGYPESTGDWQTDQIQNVNDCIRSGLIAYYNPPPTPIYPQGHTWSFLQPVQHIHTAAGVSSYDLPDDFERLSGHFTFLSSGTAYAPIRLVPAQRIRELSQLDIGDGIPCEAAIQAVDSDGSGEQGWQVVFYPAPDEEYVLEFQYFARQSMLDDTVQYPLGGPLHSEGVLKACLASAESIVNRERGLRWQEFIETLTQNITEDIRRSPRNFGQNTDPSVSFDGMTGARRPFGYPGFTINGQTWQEV